MRSTFSAVTTVLLLAGYASAAQSYVGCLDITALPTGESLLISGDEIPGRSAVGCANECAASTSTASFGYSAWSENTQLCFCLPLGGPNMENPSLSNTAAWRKAVNTAGTCASADASVYRLSSEWVGATTPCSTRVQLRGTGLTPISMPNLDACFDRCRGYLAATVNPIPEGGFNCACTTSATAANSVACGQDSSFIYRRSAAAAASAVYRRSLKETARRELAARKEHAYCPETFQACKIGGAEDGYECMDTQYELESCGGCASGEFGSLSSTIGTDCTQLSGVPMGAVSCLAGKCVAFACEKGWTLRAGVCTKA